MPPQFLGNPLVTDEWVDNSDFELNGDEEWITLPNEFAIRAERDAIIVLPDLTESDGDHISDDTIWLESEDDYDDEDYHPNEDDDYNPDEDYDYTPDEDDSTPDEDYKPDDEDYNPDDEDYEEAQEMEDINEEINDSCSPSFYGLYDDEGDDDDDIEIDYVTYPLSNITTIGDNPQTTTESNSNNLTTTEAD